MTPVPRSAKRLAARWSLSRFDPAWLLTGLVLTYAAGWSAWSATHGFGFDDDAYSTVRVWQQLLSQHVYVPSRFQGAIVAELPLGFAAWRFGALGSNLVVVACTAVSLVAFIRTLSLFGVRNRALVVAAFLANGYVLIAAATSMDYMVAFAAFSLGLYAIAAGADVLGVVLLGVSAGARIFYVCLAEVSILFVLLERRRCGARVPSLHVASCLFAAFFVSGLFYLTVWFDHGLRLDWLSAARPTEQGLAGLVARAAYKTVMFVGMAGWLLAGVGWLVFDRRRAANGVAPGAAGRPRAFAVYAGVIVAIHLALFVWIPIDPSYLIAALPFGAAVAAVLGWRGALAGLALGELVATIVVLDPLTVFHPAGDLCGRSHASGLRLRPRITPGLLVEDAGRRPLAPRCGEQVLLFKPATPTSPLPAGEPGRLYPRTEPIEIAPDW